MINTGMSIFVGLPYTPMTGREQSQEQLINKEHIKKSASAQNKIKKYENLLLEIRKQKHIDRVAKTKFMAKHLKKKTNVN